MSSRYCLSLLIGMYIYAFDVSAANAVDTQSYQIQYAKDSKIKSPPLKNIEVLIQLHKHGNSIGRVSVKTDKDGKFIIKNTVGKHLVVHILSIKDKDAQLRCRGISSLKNNLILIKCYPSKS